MSDNQQPDTDETVEPEVVAHTAEGINDDDPCPMIVNGSDIDR